MPEHLILRLEGPMQAWGDVALDTRRPTLPFPTRSALAGLFANALGWRYGDADRTTALQDALLYAVREDRAGASLVDFQTADLDDPRKDRAWTSWGREKRGDGTQLLDKHYLADASFLAAVGLLPTAPVSLAELVSALRAPARPLYLGRKSCPPATPLLQAASLEAPNPYAALLALPLTGPAPVRAWADAEDIAAVTGQPPPPGAHRDVWDRRDFAANRFLGSRRICEIGIGLANLADAPGGAAR